MMVWIWRASGLAITALFRWPKQIIGLGIVFVALAGLAAGLNALATASGLGYGFYLLMGVGLFVAGILTRGELRRRRARQAELDATRAAARDAFMAPVDAYWI